MTTNKDIDYLTEDRPIGNQRFVLMSFLSNDFINDYEDDTDEVKLQKSKKREKLKNLTTKGIKIRGCFETYEEAVERAEYLKVADPYHNIYIGEIGKWLPFEDNPDKAKDVTYSNEQLNKLMKEYNKEQEKGNKAWEARKNQMVREAVTNNENNKKSVDDDKLNKDIDEYISKLDKTDIEMNIDKASELVSDNEKALEGLKFKINTEEEDLNTRKKNLSKLSDELEKAKKMLNEINI